MARLQQIRAWASTLGARLFAILFVGLILAYGSVLSAVLLERYISAREVMLGTLRADLATSVAIVDRLPRTERPSWLDRLSRDNYKILLERGTAGMQKTTQEESEIANAIDDAIDDHYALRIESVPNDDDHLRAHIMLSDGQLVTINVGVKNILELASWFPYALLCQLIVVVVLAWIAVREAVRPLAAFAAIADHFDPGQAPEKAWEVGPIEVRKAARALNSLGERVAYYLQERVQILSSITHDLQTPVTRLRLRIETSVDEPDRQNLLNDVLDIQRLIQEGVAFARSEESLEIPSQVQLAKLIYGLASGYREQGSDVSMTTIEDLTLTTRPRAMSRLLSILVDNALLFSGKAEISAENDTNGKVLITVSDRGPGIDPAKIAAVMQPSYRVETSRNRGTGGTGLGLGIADKIARSNRARLRLYNRIGGGLAAEVCLEV